MNVRTSIGSIPNINKKDLLEFLGVQVFGLDSEQTRADPQRQPKDAMQKISNHR
jgi:hypothetical protein